MIPQDDRQKLANIIQQNDMCTETFHRYTDTWGFDTSFSQTFFMLFVSESTVPLLTDAVSSTVSDLLKVWCRSPNDESIFKWYKTYQIDCKNEKLKHFNLLRQEFEPLSAGLRCKWNGFAYNLITYAKNFALDRLKTELIQHALKKNDAQLNNLNVENDDHLYFVYCMLGATLNSMLRVTYGNNHQKEIQDKKIDLIHKLLLQYNSTDQDKETLQKHS